MSAEFDSLARPSLHPWTLARHVVVRRDLLWQLMLRSLRGNYQQSMAGVLWLLLKPLLTLAVYTYVFGFVFEARFFAHSRPRDPVEFALVLFAGLSIFSLLAEMLGKSPTLITANANFVKKVVFPLDVLVLAECLAALVVLGVNLALLLIVAWVHYGALPAAVIYLPLIVLPVVMLTLGLSWALASLGVYLRDIGQVVPVVVTALLFMSPIFFPLSAMPGAIRDIVALSPLTTVIESARAALFLGQPPDMALMLRDLAAGAVVMWLGWAWFERSREGFADVL